MHKFLLAPFAVLCLLVIGCATAAPVPTPAPTAAPATPIVAAKSGTLRFFDLVNLDVRDVPMLMALEDLEAQGYRVEKTYVASSTLIAEALSKGDADVGLFNAQTAWTAIAKGAPLRTLIQFTGTTTLLAAKNDIQDCHALDGKRFGMAATTGANPAILALYLKNECGGAKPELIVIGESAARSAAFVSGKLDATFLPGEELLKIQEQTPDKFHTLLSHSKEYPNLLVDSLHARQAWLEQNPEPARDLIRAILKANRAVIANPQLLYNESAKRLKLDPAVAKKIADVHLQNGIWSPNGGMTAESVQSSIDFYSDAAGLKKGLKVADVADLSFLNTILQEIGKQ